MAPMSSGIAESIVKWIIFYDSVDCTLKHNCTQDMKADSL